MEKVRGWGIGAIHSQWEGKKAGAFLTMGYRA